MSFDEIVDLTAGVYFYFYNIVYRRYFEVRVPGIPSTYDRLHIFCLQGLRMGRAGQHFDLFDSIFDRE